MSYSTCINCFTLLSGGTVCPKCGFDNAAYHPQPHHLLPGTVLRERYVVGKARGQGGFGITYVGFDTSLERKVAIKEYYPEGMAVRDASQSAFINCFASEGFLARYSVGIQKCMNEAKSLAQLDDIPGIVRVLDYFLENTTAYVIMEFAEGVTLVSYIKKLPQRPDYAKALDLLDPVCRALAEVHSRGFVHRDVSPDNIMVDFNGRAKLLDFGAVKMVSEEGGTTESPIIKRGFSPVELYSTKGKIGPWSDVYAFCATLFYLLTGKTAPEPMDRIQEDSVGDILLRMISPAQTGALLKGLAVQPDQRYRTVTEMAAALTACRNDPAPVPKTEPTQAKMRYDTAGERQGTDLSPDMLAAKLAFTEPAVRRETKEKNGAVSEHAEFSSLSSSEKTVVSPSRKTDVPQTGETNAPSTAGKKKTTIKSTLAVIAVVLCVVIGVVISRLSGKVPTTTSTTRPPVVALQTTATPIPAVTQEQVTAQISETPPMQDATTSLSTTQPQVENNNSATIGRFSSVDVGDYVTFGSYEQDNDIANGKEDIEWLVLAKENGRALLLSRYALECMLYNENRIPVTWETCSLRTWLNETFQNSAFSAGEKGRILTVMVPADKNPEYDTSPGNDTADNIFLLSIPEAEKYLQTNRERQCVPTAYSVAHGVDESNKYIVNSKGCCWWWLRSPGGYSDYAAGIYTNGDVDSLGCNADYYSVAVRPALWVELDA